MGTPTPDRNVADVLQTIVFAASKHKDQRRKCKSGEPYIKHPVEVAHLVATLGDSSDNIELLQAAVLHDTVEDTDTTFEELEETFGSKVASMVRCVTDDKGLPKEVRKQLQIENAPKKSKEVKILKMADKIANLRDLLTKPNGEGIPTDWSVERVQQYCSWAKEVAKGLAGVAPKMDEELDTLVNGNFEYMDGKTYPCVPGYAKRMCMVIDEQTISSEDKNRLKNAVGLEHHLSNVAVAQQEANADGVRVSLIDVHEAN
jgi:guanosine-3',5'-bis(diphosphate) 3'-pyrophosphohydrolase